jgi:ABC-type glycerol-3-phosphate transport system substrate-binding protein
LILSSGSIPGSLLSYIINDSAYAIPETQDFWVTFYRKDILDSLGIPIPKTWDEVTAILPELQRYGMNYNTPLSTGSGVKGYLATAPYIFNYGAQLYSEDGFSTGLGSEQAIQAMKFMAESFTIYGMPLTTANFYNDFRYGTIPIGISNFTTYLQLLTAAPEINGLWGIDLYPATVLEDGTQYRYATGSAQSCIMFAKTDKPNESWEFMKWWMSTDTQIDFQQQLILNYGITYLWNSANLEAFRYLPIDEQHKAVILQQWEWLQEPAKLPGSYMQERELSNAWNKIVFLGFNPRVAIDEAIILINREMERKLEEFGYLQEGVKVKELKVPTIEKVEKWIEDGN